jgi:hypothetical protein
MPEVSFTAGWRDFVSANGLVKGEQLIFSLTAMSEFQVYMFDGHGDSKTPQTLLAPLKWSKEVEISQRKSKLSLGYKRDEVSAEGETKVCPICAKRKAISEDEYAGSVPGDTCSQNSSYSNMLIEAVRVSFLVENSMTNCQSLQMRLFVIVTYLQHMCFTIVLIHDAAN